MTNSELSIAQLLRENAHESATRPAILREDTFPISHESLWGQVVRTVNQLNAFGFRRGDRVGIVLPQGPELALAFLAVACGATSAPLNPAYMEKEFAFYLRDLEARALIVMQGESTPARAAAESLGVRIIELSMRADGTFDLLGAPDTDVSSADFTVSSDVALILHTSGTTSRPKMVPLTHGNLCTSAQNIGTTLELTDADICLNVMPLFHIHGLVACVLASLAAGGGTICTRRFDADHYLRGLDVWKPSWCSAVPTMYQSILACLQEQSQPTVDSSLRFLRSSSAALPSSVMKGLEDTFRVPVIESYGMTEAAHQMTSNPLPPRARKAGSVGRPAGPEVAVLNEAGTPMDADGVGEIVIRGANVTDGYLNNPEANTEAFCQDWLRTGDQGHFDAEGYLFITGRLKELINRGGEKVAPREVDEALLAHPLVKQAVAFAVPHPSLGEDVLAAVVLQPGADCSEAELRSFALEFLPAFKAPSRVVVVPDIPRGPTGKIQRLGLAKQLADLLKIAFEAAESPMEKQVATLFCEVLGCPPVGRHDNFFMLGGDSLRATQVLTRLSKNLQLELPTPLLFRLPTPALLANELNRLETAKEIDDLGAALEGLSDSERAKLLD